VHTIGIGLAGCWLEVFGIVLLSRLELGEESKQVDELSGEVRVICSGWYAWLASDTIVPKIGTGTSQRSALA
jgi:hypothetical protein